MIVESPMPNPQTKLSLSKAVDFFIQAQRRFSEGENRLAVEAIRQSLAAIVQQDPNNEDEASDVPDAMRAARKNEEGYSERFELVRRSVKLLTDLGAHPDVHETGPKDARAAIPWPADCSNGSQHRRVEYMTRTQPIELHTDAQFSAFRQVLVRLDAPISVEEHLVFEEEVANHVANFDPRPRHPLQEC